MSFFAVTIEEIVKVDAHFNADKLEVLSLAGRDYKIIAAKGSWQAGQKCLYFPIYAILPIEIQQSFSCLKALKVCMSCHAPE